MIARRPHSRDVVVIGGGIAGLTAAQQAARRGLSVTLVEPSPVTGGLVGTVNALNDWPATGPTSGVALASALAEQARALGVAFIPDEVTAVAAAAKRWNVTSGGAVLDARCVVVASGARLRRLGIPGEDRLAGHGLSHCADCDAGFFRNAPVAVVGGGDAALHEALVLAGTCSEVIIIARSALRARRGYVDAVAALPNVRFVWDSVPVEVLGDAAVSGLRVRDLSSGDLTTIDCAGVFPFIGADPVTHFLPDTIARTASGHLVVDEVLRTSVPGICAIGAVRAGYGGDLVCAAGDAALAVRHIADELAD